MTADWKAEPPGALVWLQAWYAGHCDGDWEHDIGIRIGTLDNPGWTLSVNLVGTELDGIPYERTEIERGDHDWLTTRVADGSFQAACGPLNLGEAIHTLRLHADLAARE
jgi:hypothetical protein